MEALWIDAKAEERRAALRYRDRGRACRPDVRKQALELAPRLIVEFDGHLDRTALRVLPAHDPAVTVGARPASCPSPAGSTSAAAGPSSTREAR